jgi:hypothetical protein
MISSLRARNEENLNGVTGNFCAICAARMTNYLHFKPPMLYTVLTGFKALF